jgi:ABC-type transport system substrate-binding protein
LAARYGRAASERSGPLLVQTAQAGFRFLQFNTGRGPFTDVRLRRAVNYAIDRRALAAVLHDQPAESYIPAGLPGSPHTHVYPLSPDLARARALDHGFHGRVTLSVCTRADCTATARIIRANLARIGIRSRS